MAKSNKDVEKRVVQSTGGEDSDTFTQPEIVRIGKRIPGNWAIIAQTTGKFKNCEITNIKLDQTYHNEAQKACKMLNDYKCRLGSRKDLVSALRENDMDELADHVKYKRLQDSDNPEEKSVQDVANKMEKNLNVTVPDGPSSSNSEPGQPAIVFISYKWDIQEQVLKFKEDLESNDLTCWMDIKSMQKGDNLPNEIVKGITDCKIFVACVTKKYCQADICQQEVALAACLKKKLLPVLFEDVTWPLEGPMALPMTPLIYANCKNGVTGESLGEIVKSIKSKIQ